ncbi:MAG: HAD-IIIA family hydrolase [Elusimicrobiota bacterium]
MKSLQDSFKSPLCRGQRHGASLGLWVDGLCIISMGSIMPGARRRTKGRRAVFLDRDGVLMRYVPHLHKRDQVALLRGAAGAVSRLRRAGFRVVVVTNQSVVARGYATLAELGAIHRRLRAELRSRGAVLDAIYFCPHHPRAGTRERCRCRKPATGLIDSAVRRFRLDVERCYLIGDSTRDVRTARNAGCRAILVRTGLGGRDGQYKAKPDAVCRDLAAAAAWVLKRSRTAPGE